MADAGGPASWMPRRGEASGDVTSGGDPPTPDERSRPRRFPCDVLDGLEFIAVRAGYSQRKPFTEFEVHQHGKWLGDQFELRVSGNPSTERLRTRA